MSLTISGSGLVLAALGGMVAIAALRWRFLHGTQEQVSHAASVFMRLGSILGTAGALVIIVDATSAPAHAEQARFAAGVVTSAGMLLALKTGMRGIKSSPD